ncbi:mitochondrial import receptor subunit Tom20p [Monosporozyma servazzii]
MTSSIKRVLTLSSVAAVLGATGYAFWFDYQRRNNAEFRKNLKQRVKKQKKQAELDAIASKKARVSAVLHFLSEELQNDPISTDPSQMEAIFTTNVELGERLSMSPGNEMGAAVKFYKALAVYPNPADLLGIYQRTIPETIYEYIVIMIAVIPPTNITSFINTGAEELSKQEQEEPIISELISEQITEEDVEGSVEAVADEIEHEIEQDAEQEVEQDAEQEIKA